MFDNSIGKREGELHLYAQQHVTPTKAVPMEIPLSVKNVNNAENKDFQEKGIIGKVTEPPDWVSAPTIVNTPFAKHRIRLCIGSRPLNTLLERSEYPIPTVDHVLTQKLEMPKCLPWLITTLLSRMPCWMNPVLYSHTRWKNEMKHNAF